MRDGNEMRISRQWVNVPPSNGGGLVAGEAEPPLCLDFGLSIGNSAFTFPFFVISIFFLFFRKKNTYTFNTYEYKNKKGSVDKN